MKFLLLDGNSFCYRAFYAIRELRNSKGEPTNAVYGVITMLEKMLKDFDPDGVAVAFDVKGPTFRDKKFEGASPCPTTSCSRCLSSRKSCAR
jgi:DNA polymerase-1